MSCLQQANPLLQRSGSRTGDALHPLNAGEWVMREECSNTTREGTLKWWGFNPRARVGRDCDFINFPI